MGKISVEIITMTWLGLTGMVCDGRTENRLHLDRFSTHLPARSKKQLWGTRLFFHGWPSLDESAFRANFRLADQD
jgi:hypothetical protein